MIILPSTFEYHKYGVDARFVTECDASFILELRNNPRLARYIHSTDDDIVKQFSRDHVDDDEQDRYDHHRARDDPVKIFQ